MQNIDRQTIIDILNGKHSYGTSNIKIKEINTNIIWIGEMGTTASIGQWIRYIVDHCHNNGESIQKAYRWFIDNNTGDMPRQQNWYYGLKTDKSLILCSGCTDYSGEGSMGKQIADVFLTEFLSLSDQLIHTGDGNYLLYYLINGIEE